MLLSRGGRLDRLSFAIDMSREKETEGERDANEQTDIQNILVITEYRLPRDEDIGYNMLCASEFISSFFLGF